jgi:hypothetical protein
MFELWRAHVSDPKGLRVLDVGSTPDIQLADSNCWLPWFIETGAEVHLDSPESIEHLPKFFPGTRVVSSKRNWDSIPLAESSYDWAVSSATLEHVGSRSNQVHFIREMGRVAQAIFLTTPNRYHWLEFHTKIPLIHWLPRLLHRKILSAVGLARWAQESLLRLVGADELGKLAEEALGQDWRCQIRSVRSLGMQSNLILIAEKGKNR